MRSRTRLRVLASALAGGVVLAVAAASTAFADAAGTVQTGGTNLNTRSCASTSCGVIGRLPNGAHITIYCQMAGDTINGNWGPTNIWDEITPPSEGVSFVTDGFVNTGSNGYVAPVCQFP